MELTFGPVCNYCHHGGPNFLKWTTGMLSDGRLMAKITDSHGNAILRVRDEETGKFSARP